jgi:hypothetical protein
LGLQAFGHFDGHDAAEGEADEGEGLTGVDDLAESDGVVGEGFVGEWVDPINMDGFESFG